MVLLAKKIYLPHSNSVRRHHHHKTNMTGGSMGSVLLSRGGPGGGSSYSSIDDYIATTGNKIPNNGRGLEGRGLEQLHTKLSNLMTKPKKMKNINFNM